MKGGTLVVSRLEKLHSHFKRKLEQLGFKDIMITGVDKDGLNMLISEIKPKLMIIESNFYDCCTPFLVSDITRRFPNLNIAAVSLSLFPANIAMGFISNGVRSYVNVTEGREQFYEGLERIREGRQYICPAVMERMNKLNSLPPPARNITPNELEVIRLLCNGYTTDETASALCVCRRTINYFKKEIYSKLNVRNLGELIRAAFYLDLIKKDELRFYGGEYFIKPKTNKTKEKRRIYDFKK